MVLLLTVANAEWLLGALAQEVNDYRARTAVQSPTSSGSLNNDGSPQDGQSVCPPAKSSQAC